MKEQPQSKKWVDYSDSDSSEEEIQQIAQKVKSNDKPKQDQIKPQKAKFTYRPSKQQINNQLDKLDELNRDRVEEVWLDIFSQNLQYLEQEMKFLKTKAKKGGNVVSVYSTKQSERYEIKVYIKVAYDYIEKGYDEFDSIKVTVSSVNFQKRKNKKETQNREKESSKGEYREKNNEQKEGEKKKYVDKQTGKAPEVGKKTEQQDSFERKYTKQQAEKKGQMIGEFRNKPSNKEQTETKIEKIKPSDEIKPQYKKQQTNQIVKQQISQNEQTKNGEDKKQKQKSKKQKKLQGSKLKSQNHFEGILDL